MKKIILIIGNFLFVISIFAQQEIESISNKIDINITKDPPIISLVNGSLKFIDQDGNNCIDANESIKIQFEITNSGKGEGSNLKVYVQQTGVASGLSYDKIISTNSIAAGSKKSIEIPIKGTMELTTGTAIFSIKVDEGSGFGLDEFQMEIKTLAFVSPLVKVADYSVTSENSTTLIKKKPFDLQVLVQNVGKGIADKVNVSLSFPENVMCFSSNEINNFDKLNSGETKTIVYSLIVNEKYSLTTIPIQLKLSEKYGKFSENKTITLELNQSMSSNKIVVQSNEKVDKTVITEASLSSEVDKNIPVNTEQFSNKYALLIGNEDYSSFQPGLSKEVNVDFAINDAKIFKDYCNKILGIPDKQIKLLMNATAGQMNQGIAWLNNLAKIDNGNSELIFYYSGHGLPDEQTKDAYLIPVDVNGSNVTQGIKLSEVYNKLNENTAKKVSVFLDACFSGGARNQGLITMKGVKVKAKENMITGNMVVISSSTGEESSGVYREKQHGYMTYFLLKKLQESKGNMTYKELANYIIDSVKKETALSGKIQTPQLNYSPAIESIWEKWTIK